jgi:FKBP-type peptidyl-prolyl cis-trans isomerase FkpA
MSSATAVPLRPVSKGGLVVLWLGLLALAAAAVAYALFVSNPAQVRVETVAAGTGRAPTLTDVAVVKYEGRLADGTVFDANDEAPLPLARMVPGFAEGLQQMRLGGRYRLYIPSELGYGPEGAGPIPPNSDLVFDIELLRIMTQQEFEQMMMMQQMMQQQMQGGGAGGAPGGGAGGGAPPPPRP